MCCIRLFKNNVNLLYINETYGSVCNRLIECHKFIKLIKSVVVLAHTLIVCFKVVLVIYFI